MNMSEVTSIVQLGDNITDTEPVHFVVVGKRLDGKPSVVIIKVDSHHDITVVANTDMSSSIIETLRAVKDEEKVVRVVCSQASEQTDGIARLLVQTDKRLLCSKLTGCNATATTESHISASE